MALVVIIVGGLLLIAATAQGAPRCPGGGQPDAQGAMRMRRRILTACAAGRFDSSLTNHRLAVCNRQPQVGQ